MTVWGLIIQPNGEIATIEHPDVRGDAVRVIGETQDVVSVSGLIEWGLRDPIHFLRIDDWGQTKALPLNRKAWALYGRSPIHGPAVFHRDEGEGPLDPRVVELVTDPEFPGEDISEIMNRWLTDNDYTTGV